MTKTKCIHKHSKQNKQKPQIELINCQQQDRIYRINRLECLNIALWIGIFYCKIEMNMQYMQPIFTYTKLEQGIFLGDFHMQSKINAHNFRADCILCWPKTKNVQSTHSIYHPACCFYIVCLFKLQMDKPFLSFHLQPNQNRNFQFSECQRRWLTALCY